MKNNTILISIAFIGIVCELAFAQNAKPKQKLNETPTASIERGKAIYLKECLSCHQADGGGVPHINPPLAGNTVLLNDKTKIIWVVLKGMTDRIPIDDEYYSNNMASHAYLSNQEIADVLSYVRNSFGNKATVITAAEVKIVRGVKKK